MKEVNESIFKAYDIRGVWPSELNESSAYQIGQAFAFFLAEKGEPQRIVVGQDSRLSSPVLARAFIEGVNSQGFDIVNIGQVSIDVVYFASSFLHLPACMVTASHNPKEWNGFKLMAQNTRLLGAQSGLREIGDIIRHHRFHRQKKGGVADAEWSSMPKTGKEEEINIIPDFLRHVLSFVDIEKLRPMKIAVDASSGMVGKFLELLLDKLPFSIEKINFTPDGNFPYHSPDPTAEGNLVELETALNQGHFNFGVAFDGDGDRIVFLDETGKLVSPSIIGAILARWLLLKNRGGAVVFGITCSKIVSEIIEAYNGTAHSGKIGHTFISSRLRELGGLLGIESSGHYFFRKNFFADSGLISFLVMCEGLSNEKKSLSVLRKEFSKYYSFEESLEEEDGMKIINKVAEYFSGFDVQKIDGLSVETSNFWFNLRSSNTEPVLRLTIETRDEITLSRVKNDLKALIEKIPAQG